MAKTKKTLDDIFEVLNSQTELLNSHTELLSAHSKSLNEILEAMGVFSNTVENRFINVEKRLTYLESQMVTKEYLDDKLADLRADLGAQINNRVPALKPWSR